MAEAQSNSHSLHHSLSHNLSHSQIRSRAQPLSLLVGTRSLTLHDANRCRRRCRRAPIHNSLVFSALRLFISLLLPSWCCSSRFPEYVPLWSKPTSQNLCFISFFHLSLLAFFYSFFVGFLYFLCFCCIVWVLFALCGVVLDLGFWVWYNFILLWICGIVFELFLDYGFCSD